MMKKTLATMAAAAAITVTLAGCSGQGAASDSLEQGSADVPSSSAIETARASIESVMDSPTQFTVSEKLKSLPTGARLAVVDCGTPICALMADIAKEPAELLGMKVTVFQPGTTADSIAAAVDSIITDKYDGVMVAALQSPLWEREFKQLREAGIAVATTGVSGLPDDFHADLSSEVWNQQAGTWLADWVVSQGNVGAKSVIYRTPELGFTNDIVAVYEKRIGELCDSCLVRAVDLPVATLGNTAAQTIVDDLTANPDTSIAVMSIGEQATGLPSALKVAGIDVPITMYGAGPAQLTDIREGSLQSSLTLDSQALVWTIIDSLARQIAGQDVSEGAAGDKLIAQILTADNLKGDMSSGWTGYPDMRERFKELWQVG